MDNEIFEIEEGLLIHVRIPEDIIEIEIPDGVTKIDWNAFYGCTSLESIVIPNSVTKLNYHVFWGCISLGNITIPHNILLRQENGLYIRAMYLTDEEICKVLGLETSAKIERSNRGFNHC